MNDVWVVNASPLIVLSKAGLLGLLEKLPQRVVVPPDVAAEIEAGPEDDPARSCLAAAIIETVDVDIPNEILEWGLGTGESAVLSAALWQAGSVAVIDDAAARRCAASLGIPFLGTLGVIVRSKLHGQLTSVRDAIIAVQDAGLWIDQDIIDDLLRQLGEEQL